MRWATVRSSSSITISSVARHWRNCSTSPSARKVTFEWHPDDLARIYRSPVRSVDAALYKYMDIPNFNYGSSSYDAVLKGGNVRGLLDVRRHQLQRTPGAVAGRGRCGDINVGEELTLLWGEENGGTKKATVERHTPSSKCV